MEWWMYILLIPIGWLVGEIWEKGRQDIFNERMDNYKKKCAEKNQD